jgi:hypothetical protein
MDQSIKRRPELPPTPKHGPKPKGPMPKTFSHFSTVEEWERHRKEVEQAQKDGVPF